MKKIILLLVSLFLIFTLSNCGQKEKRVEQKKVVNDSIAQVTSQKDFSQAIKSYSPDSSKFLEEYIAAVSNPVLNKTMSLVKLNPGQTIEIEKNMKKLQGINAKEIYVINYHGKLYFPGGKIVNEQELKFTTLLEFKIEKLKSHLTREEIYPLIKKYELSARAKEKYGYTQVLNYEFFVESCKHLNLYELDSDGALLGVLKNDSIIINNDGKLRLTREQSQERRQKLKVIIPEKTI